MTFQLAGKQAPLWLAVDRLKAAGHSGTLVPSFVPGATDTNTNLVLWRWGPDLPHKVDVYDPSGRLPQNQLSLAWADRISSLILVGHANRSAIDAQVAGNPRRRGRLGRAAA